MASRDLSHSTGAAREADASSLVSDAVSPVLVERVARAMCSDLGVNPDDWSEDEGGRTYAWELERSTAAVAAAEVMHFICAPQLIAKLNHQEGYGYMPAAVRDVIGETVTLLLHAFAPEARTPLRRGNTGNTADPDQSGAEGSDAAQVSLQPREDH